MMNHTSHSHPGPTVTVTTSTTSHSTVSAYFTQRPNAEMETPEQKTLNNALVTTNKVLSDRYFLDMVRLNDHTTRLQKDQPQCQRTDQNDGRIHILHPVRTNHWCKSITDRLRRGLQMPNNAIQKTDNRKETARQTRQVEQGKRKVQQKPGRCRWSRRFDTRQENKEGDQISNSNKSKTQR